MTYTKHLREDQRDRMKDFLPGKIGDPGSSGTDNRRFVECVSLAVIARVGVRYLLNMVIGLMYTNALSSGRREVFGRSF